MPGRSFHDNCFSHLIDRESENFPFIELNCLGEIVPHGVRTLREEVVKIVMRTDNILTEVEIVLMLNEAIVTQERI